MIDAKTIAEWREAAEKASQLPWFNGSWSGRCVLEHQHGGGECKYTEFTKHPNDSYISSNTPNQELITSNDWGPILSTADAAFIALACNNFTALLDEVERLIQNYEEMRSSWYKSHEENNRYREALQWYANEKNYVTATCPDGQVVYADDSNMDEDRGARARKALGEG